MLREKDERDRRLGKHRRRSRTRSRSRSYSRSRSRSFGRRSPFASRISRSRSPPLKRRSSRSPLPLRPRSRTPKRRSRSGSFSISRYFFLVLMKICSPLCHSILQVSSDVADLDRIPAVNHRGYLRRETEIEKETEIERGIGKESVNAIAIVTATVIATETASGIEIATYYPDIDRQSDHLRGMLCIIIFIIVQETPCNVFWKYVILTNGIANGLIFQISKRKGSRERQAAITRASRWIQYLLRRFASSRLPIPWSWSRFTA